MWVRKSEEEIRAQREREEQGLRSLRRPLIVAASLSAVSVLLYSLGLRGSFRGMVVYTESPASVARTAILGAFMFTMIFVIAVFNQRRRGALTPTAGDSLLCRDCKEPSHYNPHGGCRCGGRLEPFSFFNWVES